MNIKHSLKYAIQGILVFFSTERNGQIQLGIVITIAILAGILHINATEWLILILIMTMVLALEMINTAIEKLSDMVHPGRHPQIKMIKDISAGAVLLSAVASVIAGILIFLPKILKLL